MRRSVWLASGATAAAAAAGGLMLWEIPSNKPTLLPLDERKERLACVEEKFRQQFPKVPHITVQEAHQLMQQQPDRYILVDVRNHDEQEVSMLAGNNVMTLDEYKQQQSLHKDKTAVCYCTVGYRASLAAEELMSAGVQSANLRGGILAWTHAGLPLSDGVHRDQLTKRAHTYGAALAFHGDGYEPVYYDNMYLRLLQDGVGKLTTRFLGSATM